MFTRRCHEKRLASFQVPEMLRVPLQDVILQIRLLELGRISDVLHEALEPPPQASIDSGLRILAEVGQFSHTVSPISPPPMPQVGAIDPEEELTPLGRHLAQLPVDVRIGKLLLLGTMFECLAPICTIAAALSFKSPFVAPIDRREEADLARRSFAGHAVLMSLFR